MKNSQKNTVILENENNIIGVILYLGAKVSSANVYKILRNEKGENTTYSVDDIIHTIRNMERAIY